MFANIQKIFEILDYKKKREFKILVVLMFIAMILETIGISAMIPLINYFTNENILATHNINFKQFLLELGISQQNILNFILVFIILVFLIKNLYMGLYGWLESRFAYKVRFDLGARLFDKYLNSPYLFHVENSSSNLIQSFCIFTCSTLNVEAPTVSASSAFFSSLPHRAASYCGSYNLRRARSNPHLPRHICRN